jgi:hypothetical protein
MNQRTSARLWVILGVGVVMVAGVVLLLALLGRGPDESVSMITPSLPTPADDPIVASVDGRSIRHSLWMEAVLLDQVMSGLAGQPAPASGETLQRLIDQELVLHTTPPEQAVTAEQVEAQITVLEQTWGVDDAAVVVALEKVGLTRAAFEQAVGRWLMVQAGMEALQGQGYDTTAWLEEQRASADIVLNEEFKNVAVPYIPIAQSPIATFLASPLPVPATEIPAPTPAAAIPEVAPDFTLERAGGGTLTLTEQLAQGPVVLAFIQRGG